MTNFRNSLFAVLFVYLLFAATVHAGDYAKLNFIGFSNSGKYLAFEEYGVQDGSGFPYSSFYVVNVETNSYAAGPFNSRLENERATQAQARTSARLKAAASMKKFGIVERNTGTFVVSRLFTDLTLSKLNNPESTNQTVNFAEFVDSMYTEGDYELSLDMVKTAVKACEHEELPVYRIALTLKDKKRDWTNVLQKDATLPPSRGCPLRYEMQYVYLYKNNVAVFMNYYLTGFEGPDMRYLVATGEFKQY